MTDHSSHYVYNKTHRKNNTIKTAKNLYQIYISIHNKLIVAFLLTAAPIIILANLSLLDLNVKVHLSHCMDISYFKC